MLAMSDSRTGIGHFEQDLAVAFGLDEIPDDEALVERQRLEDVGDVRRMQAVELALQLAQIALAHEIFDALARRHRLIVCHLLRLQLVAAQEVSDLLEQLLARMMSCFLSLFHVL